MVLKQICCQESMSHMHQKMMWIPHYRYLDDIEKDDANPTLESTFGEYPNWYSKVKHATKHGKALSIHPYRKLASKLHPSRVATFGDQVGLTTRENPATKTWADSNRPFTPQTSLPHSSIEDTNLWWPTQWFFWSSYASVICDLKIYNGIFYKYLYYFGHKIAKNIPPKEN